MQNSECGVRNKKDVLNLGYTGSATNRGVDRFMKKIMVVFLLAVSAASGAFAAEKTLGMKEYTSVNELAAAISSYFPKVQGEVKAVQGDTVTIALGTKDGLQQGVMLTVWRDGREILHPVTGAVIGRTEEEVGTLQIASVGETTSTGAMKKTLKEPKPGDKARITPKKINLALIPLRAERPEILQGLAESLKENGRFDLLDNEKAAAFLKEKKQRDSSLIREMGKAFKLDVAVTIEIVPSGEKYLATAGIYYADDARPLDTVVATLDLRTKRDALGEVKPFFAPAREDKADIEELPFDARLFVAGDFEGTGSPQYVFSDGVRLHVFKHDPAGWREEWTESVTHSAGEMQHINLDAADINGNGRPEIFVTGMLRDKVISYVVEFKDGLYKRIADVPGFLRIAADTRKGSILVGQAYDPVSFFAGPPKRYAWADGKYSAGAEFPLPKGVELYGFAQAEFGEANPFIVALDDKDQLCVYSQGALVWKSEEKYADVGITVMKPVTGIDEVLSSTATTIDKTRKVKISGRLYTLDLNGDGRDEVLLPRNVGDSILGNYTRAEFVGLGWTGARLEQRWDIKDIAGVVLDYQVLRRPGMGAQVLTLLMVPGKLFSSDIYRLTSYSAK
jgi:hypothetical protein